jgi:hypothetical protein
MRFQGAGWTRWLYFGILGTHTVLAIAVVPLVIVTFRRAFASRFDKHVAIARVAMPIWIYVSVTGVVVDWNPVSSMTGRQSWAVKGKSSAAPNPPAAAFFGFWARPATRKSPCLTSGPTLVTLLPWLCM